jgi:hypothetical protein
MSATASPSGLADEFRVVATLLSDALNRLGRPYYIGGSVASSMHGVMRATADIDFVSVVMRGDGERLAAQLDGQFYLAVAAVEEAISKGTSFNLIHFETSLKLDVFVAHTDLFTRLAMERAKVHSSGLRIATVEDTLLAKLRWFRDGGSISDRQWGDILGMLRVSASVLDTLYCDEMALVVGVVDLLAKARSEV